jgi:hypothetical protein
MPVTKVPAWHGIIAWDALLNGMATGLFLAAAVSELAAPAVFMRVAKVAYPVALVLLLVDLGLLVLDLGDPLRFHHMLRVFKLSSPMSLGNRLGRSRSTIRRCGRIQRSGPYSPISREWPHFPQESKSY